MVADSRIQVGPESRRDDVWVLGKASVYTIAVGVPPIPTCALIHQESRRYHLGRSVRQDRRLTEGIPYHG